MAQLNVKLSAEALDGLRRYARGRRTPVAWLIKDYIAYLLGGGTPIEAPATELTLSDMANLADKGGSLGWLAEEPEIYTVEDGEPL